MNSVRLLLIIVPTVCSFSIAQAMRYVKWENEHTAVIGYGDDNPSAETSICKSKETHPLKVIGEDKTCLLECTIILFREPDWFKNGEIYNSRIGLFIFPKDCGGMFKTISLDYIKGVIYNATNKVFIGKLKLNWKAIYGVNNWELLKLKERKNNLLKFKPKDEGFIGVIFDIVSLTEAWYWTSKKEN